VVGVVGVDSMEAGSAAWVAYCTRMVGLWRVFRNRRFLRRLCTVRSLVFREGKTLHGNGDIRYYLDR